MPIIDERTGLPELPAEAQKFVDIMNSGATLGASRNIRQINDVFLKTAKHWSGSDAQELIKALQKTATHYIENRGKNTPAIGNAINMVLLGLEDLDTDQVDKVAEFLDQRCQRYNEKSIENVTAISNMGANLLESAETILAYDYSSSQMGVLRELGERGLKKDILIPESRDLDGGRPIVRESVAVGHRIKFVIDMATSYFMREVDAVIIGAETIFANGGCWNTIGSFNMAILADYYKIPVYVPTELIKIDSRSFLGIEKEIKFDDYSEILDYPGSFEHPELISVIAPALDLVPPSLITAFITETGVISPGQLWSHAKAFLDDIHLNPFNTEEGGH